MKHVSAVHNRRATEELVGRVEGFWHRARLLNSSALQGHPQPVVFRCGSEGLVGVNSGLLCLRLPSWSRERGGGASTDVF